MKDEFGIEYSIKDFISSYDDKKSIVLFGAGKYGMHLFEYLKTNGILVKSICDNNRKLLCSMKNEYPIKYVEEIEPSDICGYFIIGISRINNMKSVKKQLEDLGVFPQQMVIPLPIESSPFFDNRIMMDDEYCMLSAREMWKDLRRTKSNQIIDYFDTNELYKLVVFEHQTVSGWLDEELQGTRIKIIKKLDSIDDFDINTKCDAVVIMNELEYELLEEKLMVMTDAPIISIWDVVTH